MVSDERSLSEEFNMKISLTLVVVLLAVDCIVDGAGILPLMAGSLHLGRHKVEVAQGLNTDQMPNYSAPSLNQKFLKWFHYLNGLVTIQTSSHSIGIGKNAVTYNTALRDRTIDSQTNIPNNRLERRDQIIETLKNSDADVICLQEVWIGEDVEAIVDGVSSTFPYSFSKIHKKNGEAPNGFHGSHGPLCDLEVLSAVTSCVSTSCTSATTIEDYWECMKTNCRTEYSGFILYSTENCITCVITALPNVAEIMESCGGAGIADDFRRINSPGTLLLSKEKIGYRKYQQFYSEKALIDRGYLFAYVRGICLVCTQLSAATLPFYPEVYIGPAHSFTSYSDQNLHEVNDLVSTFGRFTQFLFIGDFNSGLAGDNGIHGTMEDSYNALSSAFITQPVSECTVCDRDENPYNEDDENYIIDGFFGKGVQIQNVKRVFTQTDASITYNSQTLPLSDHYGVQATITSD